MKNEGIYLTASVHSTSSSAVDVWQSTAHIHIHINKQLRHWRKVYMEEFWLNYPAEVKKNEIKIVLIHVNDDSLIAVLF